VPGRLQRAKVALGTRPLVTDAAEAVLLAALGVLAVRVGIDTALPGYRPPPTAVWVLLTLALILPLAWRRRFPLSVLAVVTVVFFPYRLVDVPDLTVSVVVWWLALYSAGAYGRPRRRDLVRALNVVAALGFLAYRLVVVGGSVVEGTQLVRAAFLVLFNIAFVVAAWVFGDVVAERRRQERALLERAAQLEAEREEKARRAVFDERLRIARELHDVIAGQVSVMGVQAGAARRVMERQPARAAEALATIEHTSRHTVDELHRMLGFLRREGEPEDIAPQPRLSRLDTLLDGFDTGVDVQVSVSGVPRDVPTSLEVSAYRIVQEALTNVVKHSTAEHACVAVAYGDRRLSVAVTDDGRARDGGPSASGGHGLIGMRERVALHRGDLQAGPQPTGGFRVLATFPLDGTRA
jgi:signal transduction histidine kinase